MLKSCRGNASHYYIIILLYVNHLVGGRGRCESINSSITSHRYISLFRTHVVSVQ